jgi:hypothetical protein
MAPVADRMEITLCTHGDALNMSPPVKTESTSTTPLVSHAIMRARMGDHHALRFLYTHYADDVYDYALRIGSDHEEAREVTRRVFAGMEHLINRYEEREVPFSVWIRRVTRAIVADGIHP